MLSKSMASLVKSSLLAVAFFVSGAFSSESATRIYHHPNHGKWGNTNTNTRSPAFVPLRTLKNTAFSIGPNNGHQTKVASPRGRSYQSLPKHHHVNVNPRQQPMGTLLSSPLSDTITSESNISNSSGSAEDVAQQLREKARALRLEATAAEQTLRNSVQIKKDAVKKEADEMINLLLGSTIDADAAEDSAKGNGGASASPSISISNSIPTAQTLALRIEEHKLFSPSKLQKVVERLHERETSMMMGPEGYLSKEETSMDGETKGGEFVLGDYENNSVEYKKEETDRISGLLDRVLEAVQILDEKGLSGSSSSVSTAELSENGKLSSGGLGSKLRIRVADLRQSRDALLKRRVDTLASSSSTGSKQDGSIDGYIQSSIDGDDENQKNDKKRKQEKMLARLLELPTWLPPSLGAFAATSPVEVSVKHWKMIKTDLLTDSEFICTSWDGTDVAAIFRGRLPRASLLRSRSSSSSPDTDKEEGEDENNSITVIFEDLQARLENHAELNKRVRLFLVDDYEWRPAFVTGDYGGEDDSPPPVIIALAKEVEPEQESERGLGTKSLAIFSTLATLFTTLAYSLSAFALNPTFFNSVVKENDITVAPLCLPIFAGVLAISVLHELGHFVVAKMNGVKLGLPVPLPSLQVGTFGSITPLRSFPKTKQAMFDVAISGPGLSMLISVILLISGLNLTLGSDSFAEFPVVPAALMKSSFLVGSIVSAIAPKMMLVPLSQPIPVHPMFFVGLAGLVMSAVNLLPIGRLDGGRACMAIWGRRPASLISFLSLLALAIYSFSGVSGTIIFWGALVASTQRLPDIPAVDEVTYVGSLRMKSYIVLLALTLLTLAPFPGGALADFALDF